MVFTAVGENGERLLYHCKDCNNELVVNEHGEVSVLKKLHKTDSQTFGLDGWLTNTIHRVIGWFRKEK